MTDIISEKLFGAHGHTGGTWAMTFAEKCALVTILSHRRPEVSIEIGTLEGGSLAILAHHSRRVISIDPNPEVQRKLAPRFPNVDFITADSREALPGVLAGLQEEGAELGFVLVDGDHSAEGVTADIAAVLRYRPGAPLWLLMHDSFNPDCRRGMKAIDWSAHPHVHWLNYDFIPGFLSCIPGWEDQMWCGFALAFLDAGERTGPLPTGELLARQFEKILPLSTHAEGAGEPSA